MQTESVNVSVPEGVEDAVATTERELEDSDVSLEEVRDRLSAIKGSMAETVSDMREDRV